MKYFSMVGQINSELLDKFVNFYNSHQTEPYCIILNSKGGYSDIGHTIVRMISEMPDCRIIIHAVFSCAFDIAYNSKCKKVLFKYATGMVHQGRIDASVAFDKKIYYDEDANRAKSFNAEKRDMDKIFKKILTNEEFQKYHKREEVWLDSKRMRTIFAGAEIM